MKLKNIIITVSLLYSSLQCEKITAPNNAQKCTDQTNKQFTQCIASLPEEEQKEVIQSLGQEKRKEFITSLSLSEYNEWLDNYNEYDWAKLYNSLTPEEQSHWPRSVAEQRVATMRIYVDIIVNDLLYEQITSTVDIIPLAKTARKKVENLCFGTSSVKERVEKKFNDYKREKFNA